MSLRLKSNIVTRDIGAETALMDLQSGELFTLNETATYIYKALTTGQAQAEIISGLTNTYDVTYLDAKLAVEHILSDLDEARIVVF